MSSSSSRFLWLLKRSLLIFGLGVILFLLRSVSLDAEFISLTSKRPEPVPAAPMLKLLPEEQLKNLFTYEGIWLFPKNQCKCETTKQHKSYHFQDAYGQQDLPAVKARRQAEFEHFQRREGLPRPPPLLAPPNLPFGYPVHGVEVMPLHTVPIPGLQFEGPHAPTYEVTLTASLGTLNTLADTSGSVVQGRGQKKLTILTTDRKLLNFILQHVTYTSTVYQRHRVDMVATDPLVVTGGEDGEVSLVSLRGQTMRAVLLAPAALAEEPDSCHPFSAVLKVTLASSTSVAKFPVTICHPIIPKLYDPGPERKLRDLVTIATKTFLRPHKLMTMLQSIREYYPDLTVVVADDSKEALKINDKHVEYYTMPFGKGWFAGRNLAISQVTTKYVLWVDDDFLFINKTKIEVLVDVLEKTELDVVGGSVFGNVFQFKLLLEQSESGDCLHRKPGSFRPLDGFPSCVVTSGVVNFFLAHTERLQRVGFDPRLQRVAHSEFFIDGLGSLLVGSCPEVIIGHQPRSQVVDSELAALQKTYNTYRTNTNAQVQFKLALHYFKNHLQCST